MTRKLLSLLGGKWFLPVGAIVTLLLAMGVFKAKTDAAALRREVSALERQVAADRDRVQALKAEVQYLERPQRIEALARRHLGMAPASPDQTEALPSATPQKEEP